MNRRTWLWAAVVAVPAMVAGGLAYADAKKAQPYTCPVTGEELPCSKCCPLSEAPASAAAPAAEPAPAPRAKARDGDYTCPVTGEALPCPKCCPLNKAKK